jgi:hypothetical protein
MSGPFKISDNAATDATAVNVWLVLDVGWVKLWRDPTSTGISAAWFAPPVNVGSREMLDPTYVQQVPIQLND